MNTHSRRYDIDWLRVLAMLMIFLFHCARFFNEDDWHIKNNVLSFGMTIFVSAVGQWIMPLFFVLSASAVFFALKSRNPMQFIGERFKRLVVPLAFGAVVIIAPLQVYIERVSHGQFSGSFLSFYPVYFKGFYGFGGNFAWMGLHLWYLEMLFLFSIITLPLFLWLNKRSSRARISSAVPFFLKPGMIYLSAIPICATELIVNLQPEGIGIRVFGGWSPLSYWVFFIVGYGLSMDENFRHAIENHRLISMISGIATTVIGYFLLTHSVSSRDPWFTLIRSVNVWFWLFTILGFGSKYLRTKNRFLSYGNEAVLPFYILHQTVIVGIGFLIASWNIGIPIKYLFLAAASFVSIMAIYESTVKRINLFRFLFGMKTL